MEKKIESMRRFGHITMWCPLIISMVLGILAILVSILGTANPFFYTFSNVPELYALETGGPFGGIKVAVISIVIGFAFTVAGAILSCIAELMVGYSYVEETEEEKEEKKPVEPTKEMEEPKQEEKTHDNFVESHEEKTVEAVKETSEDETPEDEPEEEAEEDVNYQEMRHAYDDVDVSIPVVEHEEAVESEEPEEQITEEVEPVEEKQVDEPEEAEQDETEEAEEEEQYICPTFKAVYSELPKGYQIKRGDMKRDPEIKGMLHFRINGHYFKTTASGDIYDDEPWN